LRAIGVCFNGATSEDFYEKENCLETLVSF
jgi:hypothetical protein